MFKSTLKNRRAFTLIELLVVISIITLLMAVFGISANKVNKVARNLKQKAQMHSIEVGLELYQKDFGYYPDSEAVFKGGSYVYGAQHLTEALFGRDFAGIEVDSQFHGIGDGNGGGKAAGVALVDYYNPESDISTNRRKGPYMQFGDGGVNVVYMTYGDRPLYAASDMGLVYTDTAATANDTTFENRAPVITDVFRQKKIALVNDETTYVGTPLLYFKANAGSKTFKSDGEGYTREYPPGYDGWTYEYYDNYGLYNLPYVKDPTNVDMIHNFNQSYSDNGKNGAELFYDFITNPKVEAFERSQNPETFILISAGSDGIYGTKDDITNFER